MAKITVGMKENGTLTELNLTMAARHGLIAGATGTGKTVTLQRIAEQFSLAGIPVFTADVKGDLGGLAQPSQDDPKIKERLSKLKIKDFTPQACPVIFWDLFGKKGHPLRATVSEVGPLLFGRFLNANNTQQGLINAAFSFADDEGLLLIDLKDFRLLLDWMVANAQVLKTKYGNISSTSIGVLQRGLLTLNEAGGDQFFGEPALKLQDLLRINDSGKGMISILDATTLINDGRLYSTFLLWLLSELFEQLPEVGDLDKPKLVFFFDEAHLLFNSTPKFLIDKIEQMVRLIRSKGVGVYFISQNPLDIPETVLGQLGNRVQHALRAFTPKDQKAVKVAAQTFRQNPKLDTEKTIVELGVGEALISILDENGSPTLVDRVNIIPPQSRIGSLSATEQKTIIDHSPLLSVYETTQDRESAYEVLTKKMDVKHAQESIQPAKDTVDETPHRPRGRPPQSATEIFIKSTARTVGSQMGRQIIRGILGSIFGGKK
jgi:DNA helicase HerA-like ATPase